MITFSVVEDIKDKIAEVVVTKFGNFVEIESLGNVSKVIAARVMEKMEETKRRQTVLQESSQCGMNARQRIRYIVSVV